MTSDTSEIPIYAYIITIALLCIVYALVAAAKRSLDNTDRNTIKELSETDPEDSRLQAVMRFIQKPSEYHYADLFLSNLTLIMSFFLFHSLMKREMGDNHWMILWDILYFVAFIGVADILPNKLATLSQNASGIGFAGFQRIVYYITWPFVKICVCLANVFL